MSKSSLAALFILLAAGCSRNEYVRIGGYAQGGRYSVTFKLQNGIAAENVKDGIDSVLAEIDSSVNGYNPHSLIGMINSGALPFPKEADSERERIIIRLADFCDSLFIVTSGAFDARAGALYDIWGFGFKNSKFPDSLQVCTAKKDRSKLNFNAVAQGFSADLVAGYLETQGIKDYLVDIGGEIMCRGFNPKGKAWTLGIDKPVDGNMTPGTSVSAKFSVPLHNDDRCRCGIVTSGNYRKYYIRDGVKYSHTVDPRTGYPVSHNLLSATVLAPTSALADAIATYCMVIGFEQAKELIEGRDDLEGCLVSSDSLWVSKGLILL